MSFTAASLVDALRENNSEYTRNSWGTKSVKETGDPRVDLMNKLNRFDQQNRSSDIAELRKVYHEIYMRFGDTQLAKLAFYAYDIRGGKKLRDHFRVFVDFCIRNDVDILMRNAQYIPEYGRWDMMFEVLDALVSVNDYENATRIYDIIVEQLMEDTVILRTTGEKTPVSLLAKWAPDNRATKPENITRGMNWFLAKMYGIYSRKSSMNWHRTLVPLKRRIGIIESLMSQNKWDDIDFNSVPGVAFKKYQKAWTRHLESKLADHAQKVLEGNAKLNISTLNPLEIITTTGASSDVLDAMWKVRSIQEIEPSLVMADVSGSMLYPAAGTNRKYSCMDVCLALTLHIGDLQKGTPWENVALAFASNPGFIDFNAPTLQQRMMKLRRGDWGMTTNLGLAFDKVLERALQFKLTQEQMPKNIIVISDMEVNDNFYRYNGHNFTDALQKKYAQHGYTLPKLIWWNVARNSAVTHAEARQNGTIIMSGAEPETLARFFNVTTPAELVEQILADERYEVIR